MSKPQFIHSPVNRHLSCSQFGLSWKKVVVNIFVCIFGWIHHILRWFFFFFLLVPRIYCFCYDFSTWLLDVQREPECSCSWSRVWGTWQKPLSNVSAITGWAVLNWFLKLAGLWNIAGEGSMRKAYFTVWSYDSIWDIRSADVRNWDRVGLSWGKKFLIFYWSSSSLLLTLPKINIRKFFAGDTVW